MEPNHPEFHFQMIARHASDQWHWPFAEPGPSLRLDPEALK